MIKSCLTRILVLMFVSLAFLFLSPRNVYANRTITSATLNGSSSVTVAPSASITATVNVTTDAGGGGASWQGTSWIVNGVTTCVDTVNHNTAGSYTESFSITAPASNGTYNVDFIAYTNNICTTQASATFTLTGGIIVSSPTPTPAPTTGPTPTPNPGTSPTPTSSSGGTSSSSTSSTTYYPTITITRSGTVFSGTASISNGTIASVEYSFNSGGTWSSATASDGNFNSASENYSFTPNTSLTTGSHTVLARAKSQAQVYTQSSDYASISFNVDPPKIAVNNFSQNPTSNINPTITGTASSSFGSISKVEVSSNGGKNWLIAKYSKGSFQISLENLEDGNYEIVARAIDTSGNIGTSEAKTLIVDTIPPIVGGGIFYLGPQIVNPDENGVIQTVAGTTIDLTVSTRGGVTSGEVLSGEESFPLVNVIGTNFWTAHLNYSKKTQDRLQINLEDGARNKTQRDLNQIAVEDLGSITENGTNLPIKDATVKIFFFDKISKRWVVWDGYSFGQDNPQKTSEAGKYSFLVPPGKYYMQITAKGYRTTYSQIVELSQNTVLDFNFSLKSKAVFSLNLPIFGNIKISLPDFRSDSIIVRVNNKVDSSPNPIIGKPATPLTLPDASGNTVNTASSGKKYVISFISQWANPALEQISIIDSVSKKIPKDQAIYAVFLQDSESSVTSFMEHGNYGFTALADKNGDSTKNYPVTTLPEHFFIGTDGKIQMVINGLLSESQILEELSKLK